MKKFVLTLALALLVGAGTFASSTMQLTENANRSNDCQKKEMIINPDKKDNCEMLADLIAEHEGYTDAERQIVYDNCMSSTPD